MSVETGYITEEDWKDPDLEGVLSKRGSKGHIRHKWSVRYFRLKGGSLFWFKSKGSSTCAGHIPLDGAEIITNSEKTNRWPNCFLLKSKVLDKSYYIAGESPEYVKEWVRSIQRAASAGSLVTQSLAKGGRRRFEDEMDMSDSASVDEIDVGASPYAAIDVPERRPSTIHEDSASQKSRSKANSHRESQASSPAAGGKRKPSKQRDSDFVGLDESV